jgi:hypothetical protein
MILEIATRWARELFACLRKWSSFRVDCKRVNEEVRMRTSRILAVGCVLGLLLLTGNATASLVATYDINQSNSMGSGDFGDVTVTLVGGGATVRFESRSDLYFTGFGINSSSATGISTTYASVLTGNMDGFGRFTYQRDSGTNLQDVTFTLSGPWSSAEEVLSHNSGGGQGDWFWFAAKLSDGGFVAGNGTPTGSTVPIPPSALLLGSGLFGLIAVRRRKNK